MSRVTKAKARYLFTTAAVSWWYYHIRIYTSWNIATIMSQDPTQTSHTHLVDTDVYIFIPEHPPSVRPHHLHTGMLGWAPILSVISYTTTILLLLSYIIQQHTHTYVYMCSHCCAYIFIWIRRSAFTYNIQQIQQLLYVCQYSTAKKALRRLLLAVPHTAVVVVQLYVAAVRNTTITYCSIIPPRRMYVIDCVDCLSLPRVVPRVRTRRREFSLFVVDVGAVVVCTIQCAIFT